MTTPDKKTYSVELNVGELSALLEGLAVLEHSLQGKLLFGRYLDAFHKVMDAKQQYYDDNGIDN